jgi:hypothetical protein
MLLRSLKQKTESAHFFEKFLLLPLIFLLCLWHAWSENTVYYWDFGDYQSQLIDLSNVVASRGFSPFWFISTAQLSEYPLNWAAPLLLLPFPIFGVRFFFAFYLGLLGISLWIYGVRKIASFLGFGLIQTRLSQLIFLMTSGPWMLVFRGWPDVIALGLIWCGFGIALDKKKSNHAVIGIFLILSGIFMRKTTLLLGGLIIIVLLIYFLFLFFEKFITAAQMFRLFSIGFISLVSLTLVTPGFALSIFKRDNSFFYAPFQVNTLEYLGNLVSMNGLIAVVLASTAPLLLVIFWNTMRSRDLSSVVTIFALTIIPFVFTLLWMATLKQATDHHMVQWVPIYAAICSSIWIQAIHKRFIKSAFSKVIFFGLISCFFSLLLLPFVSEKTPFASPTNAFFRPVAHSIAPIVRDDISELKRLENFLIAQPISDKQLTVSVLNESHEMNAGIIKSLLRANNSSSIKVLPIGGLDFRDDPGMNRIANSDYLIVSKPFIGIIPKFQKVLRAANTHYSDLASSNKEIFSLVYSGNVGRINSSRDLNWWDNQYAKENTSIYIYKKIKRIPYSLQEELGVRILRELYDSSKLRPSIQLAAGSIESKGSDPYTDGEVSIEMLKGSSLATVLWFKDDLVVNSNCKIRVSIDGSAGEFLRNGLLRWFANSNVRIVRFENPQNSNCSVRVIPKN